MNAHNNLGLALVRQSQPVEAIKHFTQALAITPDSAETHNNLGIALAARNNMVQQCGNLPGRCN